MVNREERRKLAERMRHFTAGLITNEDLCDSIKNNTGDQTLDSISNVVAFSFEGYYCKPYRLNSRDRKDRFETCRVITFLYTDIEWYGDSQPSSWWETVLSFMRSNEPGLDFWPFLNQENYEEALKHPKLLCGKNAA